MAKFTKTNDNEYTLTIKVTRGRAIALVRALDLAAKASKDVDNLPRLMNYEIVAAWCELTPQERANVPSLVFPPPNPA